jgi:hypothetical protein
VGLDGAGQPIFVIWGDLAVGVDRESLEIYSRPAGEYRQFQATILQLKEAEASAHDGLTSMRVVETIPLTLRTRWQSRRDGIGPIKE